MYYIVAKAQGKSREVGQQGDLEKALHYADNIGMMFSDEGVSRPQKVRVSVENADRTLYVEQEYYNGYIHMVESQGV